MLSFCLLPSSKRKFSKIFPCQNSLRISCFRHSVVMPNQSSLLNLNIPTILFKLWKYVLCYVMTNEAQHREYVWVGWGTAPRIFFYLCIRWRWVVSLTARSLYLRRKKPRYLLDRRLGGTQSASGRGGEEKKLLSLLGIKRRSSSP